MPLAINPIRLADPASIASIAPTPAATPGEFGSLLSNAVGQVEQYNNQANTAISRMLSGENQELHQVALATQQAELAFDLGLQIRNKVVSAYQEVMRMQV